MAAKALYGMSGLILEIKGDVGRAGQRDAEKVRVG